MRLWWRHARQGVTVAVLLMLVVAIGAALLTATPRLQRHLFEEETASQIANLAPISRALTTQTGATSPWRTFIEATAEQRREALDAIAAQAGPTLTQILEPGQFSLEPVNPPSPEFPTPTPEGLNGRELVPLIDSELLDRVTFTQGQAPASAPFDFSSAEEMDAVTPGLAISADTARTLDLRVGDTIDLHVGWEGATTVMISGIFEPIDPADLVWQAHPRALTPYLKDDPNSGVAALGVGILHPDAGWFLLINMGESQFNVRYGLAQTPVNTADLARDLTAFTSDRYDFGDDEDLTGLKFESRLGDVLARALGVRAATTGALWVLLVGPIGGALAVCVLATQLSRARRTSALALLRARGASPAQLRAMSAAAGLGYGILAAGAGAGLALALTPGELTPSGGFAWVDLAGAALFALAPALALAAAPLPRVGVTAAGSGRLRIVAEVAVLALTGAAIYAATDRGLVGGGLDPLTIAVPVLVAAATAVLGIRLLPLVLGAIHALTRRGRGLTAFLGSARAVTRAAWPVVTITLAVGTAIFSTTLFTTLESGARAAAYAAVGADLRVAAGPITPEQQTDLAKIPGIAGQAGIHNFDRTWITDGEKNERITLLAVDAAALGAVQANVPGATDLSVLTAPPQAGRVPVLASPGIGLAGGLTLGLDVDIPIEVVGEPAAVLGVSDRGNWILADSAALTAAGQETLPLPRTMLVHLADDGDTTVTGVEAAIEALLTPVTFATPADALADFESSPSVTGLRFAAAAAFALATGFAGLAVVLLLTLRGPSRSYLVGIVRTLGGRLGAGLVAWEAIPAAAVGIAGGIGVGWYLPRFLTGVSDLRAFTGGADPPPIVTEVALAAAPVVIMLIVVVIAIASAGAVATRRMQQSLRIGE